MKTAEDQIVKGTREVVSGMIIGGMELAEADGCECPLTPPKLCNERSIELTLYKLAVWVLSLVPWHSLVSGLLRLPARFSRRGRSRMWTKCVYETKWGC
jgi:hypothetical protein